VFTCICCGESFRDDAHVDAQNPNVCVECAGLIEDEQDNMIIESAIPLDLQSTEASATLTDDAKVGVSREAATEAPKPRRPSKSLQ